MQQKQYSSDLCGYDWQRVEPMIPVYRAGKWPLHEIVNGILYRLKNDCAWQDVPSDLPPWYIIRYHFLKWVADGTWQQIDKYLLDHYGKNTACRARKRQPGLVLNLSWMKNAAPASGGPARPAPPPRAGATGQHPLPTAA